MKNQEGDKAKLDVKLREALPLVEFSARLAEIQLAVGRRFMGENPLTSKEWQTKPGHRMLCKLYSTKTHMCAHGLKDPEFGMPVRKSTKLVTTSKSISEDLGLLCPGGHDHRVIKSAWRDEKGKRVNASAWRGGYNLEFSNNILDAFEKQLKADIKKCFAVTQLDSDLVRKKLLDDVPQSIRQHMARRRMLDDVPASIRRALEPHQSQLKEQATAKRRKELLDDVPLSIKTKLNLEKPQERDLEEEACILKAWRQKEILKGTTKAIQDKIEERRRQRLSAGPYEKTTHFDERSATVTRPAWTPPLTTSTPTRAQCTNGKRTVSWPPGVTRDNPVRTIKTYCLIGLRDRVRNPRVVVARPQCSRQKPRR
jgi:hypothetical protein